MLRNGLTGKNSCAAAHSGTQGTSTLQTSVCRTKSPDTVHATHLDHEMLPRVVTLMRNLNAHEIISTVLPAFSTCRNGPSRHEWSGYLCYVMINATDMASSPCTLEEQEEQRAVKS